GVLNVAQGHPKLLELADGQAAHPDRLAELVEAGDQAWREQGGLPGGVFAAAISSPPDQAAVPARKTAMPAWKANVPDGEASAGDYWHVLAAWTRAVADTLPTGQRDLFWFLCCLEESDRERPVLDGNWTDLWERLARPGPAPDLDGALGALAAQSLIAQRAW